MPPMKTNPPIRLDMNKKIIPVSIFIVSLCLFGCGKKGMTIDPTIASSDEALFLRGEQFAEKDPEKARLYFRQVIDSFPKSFYAQRAKIAIADSYFEEQDEGSMIIAASEYREFISLYPYSPTAPTAQYKIAMTFYKKLLAPGRDQSKTRQGLEEFRKVVKNYPTSDEAKLAQDKIKACEENLAEHTLTIGRHYYKVHAYKAATSRLAEVLTAYPNFTKMDHVYFYLGDSYYGWDKPEEAVPYFTKLLSDYPQSKFIKKATKRMELIQTEAQEKPSRK